MIHNNLISKIIGCKSNMSMCCTAFWVLIILIIIKLCLKLSTKWSNSQVCLAGKTAIVTGANTGIGFETALDFAKRGARVILACRNADKAEVARDTIIRLSNNTDVCYRLIDMAAFDSVREFAKNINASETRLDILVNNAGGGFMPPDKTVDGYVTVYQVNHLAPFLLTNLLSDLLKRTRGSRIVNVSALAASFGKCDLDIMDKPYPGHAAAYSQSKLWNILFTKELARRLQGHDVTTYSLHPGIISTDIFRYMSLPMYILHVHIAKPFFKTAVEGAQTTIHVSVAHDLEKLSGSHFHECTSVWRYWNARNEGDDKKLWEKSEQMVHLTASDAKF